MCVSTTKEVKENYRISSRYCVTLYEKLERMSPIQIKLWCSKPGWKEAELWWPRYLDCCHILVRSPLELPDCVRALLLHYQMPHKAQNFITKVHADAWIPSILQQKHAFKTPDGHHIYTKNSEQNLSLSASFMNAAVEQSTQNTATSVCFEELQSKMECAKQWTLYKLTESLKTEKWQSGLTKTKWADSTLYSVRNY